MKDLILKLPEQLNWTPELKRSERLNLSAKSYLLAGMGGSHLAGDIILAWQPECDISIWSDYGLPTGLSDECLVIISSYSGNTEEAIDNAETARRQGRRPVVITSGGYLYELAEREKWPLIALPPNWPPRLATGFGLKALALLVVSSELSDRLVMAGRDLDPLAFEEGGKRLAGNLLEGVPVIYTERSLSALAYNWKIKINENSKLPAFWGLIPEVNHNELMGFGCQFLPPTIREGFFRFVFLIDGEGHARNLRRFKVLAQMYRDQGWPVEEVFLPGDDRLSKLLNGMVLGDWTSFYLASFRDIDPVSVPLIEDFKKKLDQE